MWPWKKLSERRTKYLEDRKSLSISDEEYMYITMQDASQLEQKIAIVIRNVLADECAIAPEKINPNDKCTILNDLMGPEGFWGYYFQPIKGFMGFDAKIFYHKLMNQLLTLRLLSESIPINKLLSLAFFAKNANYQKDYTVSLKQWVRKLNSEIIAGSQEAETLPSFVECG